MTWTWREGEAWTKDEGAPEGPAFDTVVHSSRKGHGPYRLRRDPVTVTILHQPPCEAWAHGHKNCRHVQEACRQADAPDAVFALAIHELIVHRNLGYRPAVYADPVVQKWISDLTEAHNEWMAARERIGDKTLLDASRAEWAAKSPEEQLADAVETFSRPLRVTP